MSIMNLWVMKYVLLMLAFVKYMEGKEEVVSYSAEDGRKDTTMQKIISNTSDLIKVEDDWTVETSPPELLGLVWKLGETVLTVNVTNQPTGTRLVSIAAEIDQTDVAVIVGPSHINYLKDDLNTNTSKVQATFAVKPVLLGRAKLTLTVLYTNLSSKAKDSDVQTKAIKTLEISVVKPKKLIDTIFTYSVYLMLMIVTLTMGAEMDLPKVREILRRPKAPLIALICQFIIMPLLAYGIIMLLGYQGGTALGFFTLGCSPGGGPSNMYAHLLGGDLSVSVTMTLLSTVISVAMLPLWLYTLGTTFPSDGTDAVIPYMIILQTLAVLLVPLAIGMLITYKLPRVGLIFKKCLKALMITMVIFIFTFGIYTNVYIFEMFDPKMVFAGALLPYGGFMLGALLAFACRLEWTLIKTISIETGLQNAGISFFMVQAAFTSPDLELATIPVASCIIMTPLPLLIATFCYSIYNKCQPKNESLDESITDCSSTDCSSTTSDPHKSFELLPLHQSDDSQISEKDPSPPEYDLFLTEQQNFVRIV